VKSRLLVPVALLALLTGCGPAATPPDGPTSATPAATSPSAVQPSSDAATTPAPATTPPAAPPTTAAAAGGNANGGGTGGSNGGGSGGGANGGACPANDYRNSSGICVPRPTHAPAPPPGATAECWDGTYSFSQHRSGTCSHHGGVKRWL
jgi:hypothetical protein